VKGIMSARRTVHIPIVQPGRRVGGGLPTEDRLIEIYTQIDALDVLTRHEQEDALRSDLKARDKDWDRVAAPLRKVGLYQAGCAAASAVRKLGLRRPLTALYQQVSRLAWIDRQRLHAATPQGPTEGRSAELGLALVLLMGASGSRDRQIIATGALGGQPQGVETDDVEVLPVGSLVEKLNLVLALARHKALPGLAPGRKLLFFTPRRFQDGEQWREVAGLVEVEALASYGVEVRPVERLGEAAAALKADRSRHLIADRVAAAALLALALVSGAGMASSAIRETHVPMTFLPAGGSALEPEPFEACFTPDGGYYPVPLQQRGIGRRVPAGATLGWRVRIGESHDQRNALLAWLAPDLYYVAQVMLSEHSPAKVMVPDQPGQDLVTVAPGAVWEWGWELNERAESNGLVLLARADAPFDPDALRADLLERFPAAAGGAEAPLDVTAAANFVASRAPGAARFIVQTVEDVSACQS
jgi:hypothetical protein